MLLIPNLAFAGEEAQPPDPVLLNICTCTNSLLSCGAACNGPGDCCSGLACEAIVPSAPGIMECCIPGGTACTGSTGSCCSSAKFCVLQPNAGAPTCAACIPENNPEECASDGDCCSGACASYGRCVAAGASGWYDNIYLWIGLSVLTSATIIVLAYMTSKAFELQVLEAWVKIETSELFASVLIAVFCVALIATFNASAQFLVGASGGTDVVGVARAATIGLYNDGNALYGKLAESYFNLAKVSSYSYSAGLSTGYVSASFSQAPLAGLSPLLADIGQAMDSVSNFMTLAAAQHAFLRFFAGAATVMLPVGIFLRSFSFSRKLGAVVLSATIAVAVIYPSSVMVSDALYQNFRPKMMENVNGISTPSPGDPPDAEVICDPLMQKFVSSPIGVGGELGWSLLVCYIPCAASLGTYAYGCSLQCTQDVNRIYSIVKAVYPIMMFSSLSNYAGGGASSVSEVATGSYPPEYYDNLSQYALPAVSEYAVLSIVFFLLPVIVAIVLLRSLSIAFGGEPQLYGLSKLV